MGKIAKDKKKEKSGKGKKSDSVYASSKAGRKPRQNPGLFPLNGMNPLLPLILNNQLPVIQDMNQNQLNNQDNQTQALETFKALFQLMGLPVAGTPVYNPNENQSTVKPNMNFFQNLQPQ